MDRIYPSRIVLPGSLLFIMISTNSIPESLRLDKDVTPFVSRAIELEQVNPVVSYYCKIYIIEHILSQKFHIDDEGVQAFTMALLDDTEAIKKSEENHTLKEVLNSRQLSVNAVFVFAFKMFNSCLEDLNNYDSMNKAKIGAKIKAALNFWSLLVLFYNQTEDTVDFDKTTGGACLNAKEFAAFCKEKQKTLKYQLSRLIKNEIPMKNEDEELERELEYLNFQQNQTSSLPGAPSCDPSGSFLKDIDVNDGASKVNNREDFNSKRKTAKDNLALPGAPSFEPSTDDKSDLDSINLPGTPKFLPHNDPPQVNKKSSIIVYPPKSEEAKLADERPTSPPKSAPQINKARSAAVHVTKENVNLILDFGEQISKIQKHAKFAVSALNYEDLDTAEKELIAGLELLRQAKSNQ